LIYWPSLQWFMAETSVLSQTAILSPLLPPPLPLPLPQDCLFLYATIEFVRNYLCYYISKCSFDKQTAIWNERNPDPNKPPEPNGIRCAVKVSIISYFVYPCINCISSPNLVGRLYCDPSFYSLSPAQLFPEITIIKCDIAFYSTLSLLWLNLVTTAKLIDGVIIPSNKVAMIPLPGSLSHPLLTPSCGRAKWKVARFTPAG